MAPLHVATHASIYYLSSSPFPPTHASSYLAVLHCFMYFLLQKIEVVCEKDLLEEEVKLLQGDVSRYRAEVTQLQEKVERYKMKYEDRKKQVKERLSKSL